MGVRRTVVQFMVLAFIMAFWQLYLLEIFQKWFETQGKTMGLGETAFLNFLFLLIAYTCTKILVPGGEK